MTQTELFNDRIQGQRQTQKLRIIAYLRQHGSITALEAFTELGVQQLHGRLSELRDDGYEFRDEWYTGTSNQGYKYASKRYYEVR